MSTIHYCIIPKNPEAHLFQVRLTISEPDPEGQRLSLPAWIPGSYLIRDFAKHMVQLRAESQGHSLMVQKIDKSTWCCAPSMGPLVISYEIYAWDNSVRAAHLDTTHGFFNGTSVFLRVEGQADRLCAVTILPPEGEAYCRWQIATTLPRAGAEPYSFGNYQAADYDELVDHPVEMGQFSLATFNACGIPHDIAITGRHRADMDRLCRDLKILCEQHIHFFGEPAPMDRYVFLITVVGEGYGGLEHRASTAVLCNRNDLPRAGEMETREGYRNFLGLCSHEYFHTWNIKRIKPAAFTPYNLSNENYTRLLWAFEGITSYYDELGLVRSGLISQENYLEVLGQTITRVLRGPGRFKQSLAESSFDAWIKFYQQDENTPNAIVSYYTKGSLVALALDLILRRETQCKCSLDKVMRVLWEAYGKTGIGVPEGEIEQLIGEVSGLDLSTFFDAALRGTEDLALAPLLASVGVNYELRCSESSEDKGGNPGRGGNPRTMLGVRLVSNEREARLSQVFDDGAAQLAGLAAGDVVIAVDGIRATASNLEKIIESYPAGLTIRIHAFRRDELREFEVTLKAAPQDTCVLTIDHSANPEAVAARCSWLLGIS
ncbi:MAG: M61 family metallopeptidase [Candidatus Nitrosoglobus sp.]|jgi:predicted metalloprotease with PDZ domain